MIPGHDHNRRAWDARARKGQRFARPVSDRDFNAAEDAVETETWLNAEFRGKDVLCLAAGGGRQSILYAARGAKVTVIDISPEMLAIDRQVAAERQLAVVTVEASMDDLSSISADSFDYVIQPVSTCYVSDVSKVYREVARVIRRGGVYVSQHKQPASLQAGVQPSPSGYELQERYYREGPLPPVSDSRHREEGTLEYLHRWDQLLGGMCRAGFVIEDLVEPSHNNARQPPGTFAHRSSYVAPYVRVRSRYVGDAQKPPSGGCSPGGIVVLD
ncbi:MAG: class I SAM-dependent methyltransferase [Pirellulales bacterium]|nr:class I SAM-dependent methyltransferase [Pirellulales bacterium]